MIFLRRPASYRIVASSRRTGTGKYRAAGYDEGRPVRLRPGPALHFAHPAAPDLDGRPSTNQGSRAMVLGWIMTWQGKIIEYIENGKFICAWVLEESGNRLRLLNQNGREVSLPAARLLHHSSVAYPPNRSREEILGQLREVAERRHELMQGIDLQQIWELASEEQDSVFEPRFLAELGFGAAADDDSVAAFLRAIFGDRLLFKYKNGGIVAHSPEVVEQLRLKQEQEKQRHEFLDRGAVGLLRIIQGEPAGDWPEREICLAMVRDYYLFGSEARENETARALLGKVHLTSPHDPFHLLVKAGVWDRDENIPLLRQNLNTTFTEEARHQASSLRQPEPAELLAGGRRDLRRLPLFTIDSEATRDLDDALHLERQGENYLVGVHIADVAHYIKPGSPLFAEARERITSLYLPDRTLPMLPPAVSEEICSLKEGEPRPAMSFLVLLSPEAEILEFELRSTLVTVARRLSYHDADRMAAEEGDIADLFRLATRLRRRRLEAGAVLMPFPDVNIRIDGEGNVSIALAEVDTPGRLLVAELMILANTLGARYLIEHETPGLFRSQPPPHRRLVTGGEKDLFLNSRQRKQLSPMALTTRPKPHSGIGAQHYTTVTSPIRRFLDLLMQQQLSGLLQGRGASFQARELRELAGTITTTQGRVNQVRFLRHRYWLLKHLEQRLGEQFDALILEKTPRRVNLLLPDFLLETEIPPNRAIRAEPGETIHVTLIKADRLDNVIRVELAADKSRF